MDNRVRSALPRPCLTIAWMMAVVVRVGDAIQVDSEPAQLGLEPLLAAAGALGGRARRMRTPALW